MLIAERVDVRAPAPRWLKTAILYGGLWAAQLLLRFHAILGGAPTAEAGTGPFVDVAKQPLASPTFYNGFRGFFVPLAYKLLGTSGAPGPAYRTMLAQAAFATMCWTILAIVAARRVTPGWFRMVAFGAVLLFSLSANIAVWDTRLLSESWSLSLLALLAAHVVWLSGRPTPLPRATPRAALFLSSLALTTLAWCFTRDSNVYVALSGAGLVTIAALAGRALRRWIPVALVLVAVGLLANWSVDQGDRWRGGLINVMSIRLLPNPADYAWFERQGMPDSPALRQLIGKDFTDPRWYDNPALAGWDPWFEQHGRPAYALYLATHPTFAVVDLVDHAGSLLSPYFRDRWAPDTSPPLPALLDGVAWPQDDWLYLWILLVGGSALAVRRARREVPWIIPVGLALLVLPNLAVSWHGDTVDVERHAIGANVELRLAVLVLALFVLDAFLRTRSRARDDSALDRVLPLTYAGLGLALVLAQLFPAWGLGAAQALHPPFTPDSGFAFITTAGIPANGDSLDYLAVSRLTLYENGVALGPPHALHAMIRTTGNGEFSHWNSGLYFSSSDNSSPNQNGRQYAVREPLPFGLNTVAYLVAATFLIILTLIGRNRAFGTRIFPMSTSQPKPAPGSMED